MTFFNDNHCVLVSFNEDTNVCFILKVRWTLFTLQLHTVVYKFCLDLAESELWLCQCYVTVNAHITNKEIIIIIISMNWQYCSMNEWLQWELNP